MGERQVETQKVREKQAETDTTDRVGVKATQCTIIVIRTWRIIEERQRKIVG